MKTEPILYCLTPDDPAGHLFKVRISIAHPSPQGQALSLPAWIPGSYLIRDFSRHITSIQAHCDGRNITILKTDSHTWRCDPCSGPLHVDYTVYAWDLSVRGAHFDESHAFFNGANVFLAADGHTQSPCQVHIFAPTFKNNWKVYTGLRPAQDHKDAAQRHGFGVYAAPDYDALIDYPIEMGTPKVVTFKAHGAEHEMVFTGLTPRMDIDRIAADAQKICASQIELFEPDSRYAPFTDSADRYVFLTTITGDSYGGLEHRASTALMASRRDLPVKGQGKAPDGYQTFLGLISHEYFHTWNIKRIKPAAFVPYDLSRQNHTRLLWVFEGFTSYYDDLMLLRSGAIDHASYLGLVAKTIAAVRRNAGRHKQTVAESSFDAWTRYYKQDENSPNAIVSYYTKGALVALGIDLTIRQATNGQRSLDDVMRLLWQKFGRDFYRSQELRSGLPEDAMVSLIEQATGVDTSDFIARHVDGHDDVPLEKLLATQGITLARKAPNTRPSLGIRTQSAHNETRIGTLYEGGAAHAAGMSAGDVILALDGLRVTDQASLEQLLNRYIAGDKVTVHVFRRDELRVFKATLASPEESEFTLEPTAPATP